MSSLNLPELEKKIIPKCRFIWSQKVLNVSQRIISLCEDEKQVFTFLKECEEKVKKLDTESRISYNTEIQNFSGDEYYYLWYFYSNTLDIPVKLALKVEVLEEVVIVGKMDLPDRKEQRKLAKHLYSPNGSQFKEDAKNEMP